MTAAPLTLIGIGVLFFPSKSNDATWLADDGPILWWLPLQGVTLGLLIALLAIGMALVFRANRVLNFAQGDIGLLPTSLVVSCISFSSMNYFVAAGIGLVVAPLVGAVAELAVVRRFFASSRLILTVATIGLAQLLAVASLALPLLWGEDPLQRSISMPVDWRIEISGFFFDADYLVAWIGAPLAIASVVWFLGRTDVGVATRAAADRADRAALLGIPVGRLHTVTWAIAGTLSFLALFAKAGITGLTIGSAVGLSTILSALAALVLGRMTNLAAVGASAVALGMLEAHVRWRESVVLGPWSLDVSSDAAWPLVLFVIIAVALATRRIAVTRADQDSTSSWTAASAVRPLPAAARRLPVVRLATAASSCTVVAILVALPHLPVLGGVGETYRSATILVYAVIIMSVTVLTGWAGQVSLGQMGFVAIGAAVGATAAVDWSIDVVFAVPIAGAVGAVVATLIGLPAVRLRGLHLAVTSLAFALATTTYLLNPRFAPWVPVDTFEPEPALGLWDWSTSADGTYYLALVFFALVVAGMTGIRSSRTGRALAAVRDNEASATAYGISPVRAKLIAFAISGFLAASAGSMLVHQTAGYSPGLFPDEENLVVFTAAVIGGVGSLSGAVLGALFLKGGQWLFTDDPWDRLGPLLSSSAGVLLVLMLLPGGLTGALFRLRDALVGRVAVAPEDDP